MAFSRRLSEASASTQRVFWNSLGHLCHSITERIRQEQTKPLELANRWREVAQAGLIRNLVNKAESRFRKKLRKVQRDAVINVSSSSEDDDDVIFVSARPARRRLQLHPPTQ